MVDQSLPNKTPTIGAMALYSLVSRNVFDPKSSGDFFSSLLPFFEPYIASVTGELFDLDGLLDYAKSQIFMPINRDVAEIFAKRMVDVKWLKRETGSKQGVIYRVAYEKAAPFEDNSNVDADLSYIVDDITRFSKDKFGLELDQPNLKIQDRLLSFLVRTASSREAELLVAAPSSGELSTERADYVISRYISDIEKRSPAILVHPVGCPP